MELEEIPTHKKFLSVRQEGFTMDDERLKQQIQQKIRNPEI